MKTVLLVDDSETARLLLRRIIDADPEMQVVAEARDGAEAVARTRAVQPDLVVMDVQMPHMDGFEATRRIMTETPTPIVIATTTLTQHEVEVSFKALSNGALLALQKPPGPADPDFNSKAAYFRRMLRLMAEVRVHRRLFNTQRPLTPPTQARAADLVAIAASTGGPAAINAVLAPLPAAFPLPIVIVQHIAKGFSAGFARWLNSELTLPVALATHGERPQPGHVYLAPDDLHLAVAHDGTLQLSADEPLHGFRPSADHLFQSIATHLRTRSINVILTGMGEDGARGLEAVHRAGGWVIAQDEESAVVWSMPRAVIERRCADDVLPVSQIGEMLCSLLNIPSNRTQR